MVKVKVMSDIKIEKRYSSCTVWGENVLIFLFSIKLTKDDRGSKVNLLFIYPCLASNFVKRIHKRADGILKKNLRLPWSALHEISPRKKASLSNAISRFFHLSNKTQTHVPNVYQKCTNENFVSISWYTTFIHLRTHWNAKQVHHIFGGGCREGLE